MNSLVDAAQRRMAAQVERTAYSSIQFTDVGFFSGRTIQILSPRFHLKRRNGWVHSNFNPAIAMPTNDAPPPERIVVPFQEPLVGVNRGFEPISLPVVAHHFKHVRTQETIDFVKNTKRFDYWYEEE